MAIAQSHEEAAERHEPHRGHARARRKRWERPAKAQVRPAERTSRRASRVSRLAAMAGDTIQHPPGIRHLRSPRERPNPDPRGTHSRLAIRHGFQDGCFLLT